MRSAVFIAVVVSAISTGVVAAESPEREEHLVDVIVDADNAQLESDRQIFCRRMKFSGSHLKRRVCLPLGQWKRMNWTPRREKEPDLYEQDPSDGNARQR